MDLMSLTAVELGKKIQAKEVTVEEAVKAAIASIKAKEEKINSFVTIDEEGALKKAAEVQAKIDAVELKGALAGVPVPAMSSALSYFDGYTSERLPANLLQAQRDYFGAHTYERTDAPRGKFFHTNWTGEGGDTSATIYNA